MEINIRESIEEKMGDSCDVVGILVDNSTGPETGCERGYENQKKRRGMYYGYVLA